MGHELNECLEDHTGECQGAIEYRYPLSGTGKSFPRCDFHWQKRLDLQDEINKKYAPDSDCPPSGFGPAWGGHWENDMGERWDED